MILVLCCASLRAQDVEEVVKVDVALVTVNVLVTDARGRPLPGLQAFDFQVTEQGKPMRVEFFDNLGPASIVLVMDMSSSMRNEKWRNLKAGMKKFLAQAHSGNDYTLIGFSHKPRIIAREVKEDELWQAINSVVPNGNTALYDAVLLGLSVLQEISQRHKALILFSDGEDNCSSAGLAEVKQQVVSSRATIYTVGILTDDYFFVSESRAGKELLKELAAATGGLVHFPSLEKIKRALEEIKADLSNRYSLSYYPTEKTTGWRRVEVSLTPSLQRLKLRYQQRYLVK